MLSETEASGKFYQVNGQDRNDEDCRLIERPNGVKLQDFPEGKKGINGPHFEYGAV